MRLLFTSALLLTITCAGQAQTLGSCKIFPTNNPWNTRIDSLPVHPRSAQFIASVGGTIHVHPDFGSNAGYGIPWVAVPPTQPMVPIIFDQNSYTDQSDPGPMPVPLNAPIEGGGNDGGDDHVLVVDTGHQKLYELYQGSRSGAGWRATSTAIFSLDSNNFRPDGWTSCDAAGLPIWPGLVRQYECKAGEIKHALRFTIPHSSRGYVFPARHYASSNTDTTTVMPMGLRLRLKASYDDSKDTGNAKVIITALKRYGIILADNGSSWYISGETNTSWDDNDIGQLRAITGNDFEVVYSGPIARDSGQYSTPVIPIPSNTTGISAPAIAYDTVLAGTSNTFPVVLRNTGNATVTVNTIKIKSGTSYATNATPPLTIAANGTLSIPIIFTSSVPGQVVDTLTIKSDDPTNPSVKVALVGLGTYGTFHLKQPSYSFGKVVVGQTDTMMFSFNNTGLGSLSVDVNNTNGTNPDFAIVGIFPPGLPPFVVQPGDSIRAQVQFNPIMVGKDTTTFILIISDYAGESHDTTVMITGEGIASSSVAEPLQPLGVRMYPNPTQGTLSISNPGGATGSLEVTDALGRSVSTTRLSATGGTLDLSSLPNGSYFVRVLDTNGTSGQRIIVAH